MKRVPITVFIGLSLIFTLTLNISTADTDDHCDNPTDTVQITADPDGDGSLKYDKTELIVPKNACVTIIFKNLGSSEHSFTIDPVAGDEGITRVHIDLDGIGGDDDDIEDDINIMTPNADAEFSFYSSTDDGNIKEEGMEGKLIVGKGNEADNGFLPGFEIPIFVVIIITALFVSKSKKRQTDDRI